MKTAIVIGVGPERGLGAQLCKRFAADGLKVIVAGRTSSMLEAVANDIEKSGAQAVPFVADATKENDVAALFDAAGGELDLAIYNAGNNTPGRIIEMEADYFESAWRVVCFGGFLFGREAVRRMAPKKTGTLLFTGASPRCAGAPALALSTPPRPACARSPRRWPRNMRPTESTSLMSWSTVRSPATRS
ncbi:SDR family NAD(P)-dependent oxidoreductase [Bradyrhizobium iriomotense]|nr:SDR family NAD(P)-dependent oxidoreductase [Bradyrhizobium iriomotense]